MRLATGHITFIDKFRLLGFSFIKCSNSFLFFSSEAARPEVFCKKGTLKNFVKFTGKHLCQSLFFNKVAGLRPATLFKKGSDKGIFL